MSTRYKIQNQSACHFITFTVTQGIDLFTKHGSKRILTSSIAHCIKHKGLQLHAYVFMSNHIHLMASMAEGKSLSSCIRDLKRNTSKRLARYVEMHADLRKDWMLNTFASEASKDNRHRKYKIWEEGCQASEIPQADLFDQKLNYMHENPVRAGYVSKPEDYLYSSAKHYTGVETKAILPVIPL